MDFTSGKSIPHSLHARPLSNTMRLLIENDHPPINTDFSCGSSTPHATHPSTPRTVSDACLKELDGSDDFSFPIAIDTSDALFSISQ